ncbi:response regulator [Methylobacillus flagellatus]|uniref:CHASE domain-containing hybrid sensor histidine kinase/response regulator n=1 Tax=Methylobacillus flagellatus TaxID=405 RepID=UPI0028538DFA|nr:response regulator [Methylobacillus flagellatus]MDR5171082.1 response regulator [Methylobacillus flagellatus]
MGKKKHGWPLALGVFILGMVVTAIIARAQFYNSSLQSRQFELARAAGQELHHSIQSEIQHAVDFVQATGWLFNASESVSRAEFTEFSVNAIHHSHLLKELQWRPRVKAADVPGLVEAAARDGMTGFRLLEQDAGSDAFIPARARDEYFPIFYSEMAFEETANPSLLGVDTLIGTPDFKTLEQGIAGKHSVVMSIMDANQFMVMVPVFADDERDIEHLAGYVAGRLSIQQLLHTLEQQAAKLDMDVILLDRAGMRLPILQVVAPGSPLRQLDSQQPYEPEIWDVSLPFSIADFSGTLVVHPHASLSYQHAGSILAIVVLGMLISALLAGLLYRMLGEQRAVKLSEEQLDSLTGNLPVGVFQMHAGNGTPARFTFVNASACQLLDVPEERILADWQNAFLHVVPEQRLELLAALRRAKDNKQVWDGEFRLQVGPDTRWLRARAVPRHTMLGELVYNGFVEDVTERRRIEQEVRSQSLFLQQLIDNIPSPLFFKGSDSRFLGCNRAYEHEFGVSRDRMIGKTVLEMEYLPYEDRMAYQEEDEHVIATGATVHKALSLRFADGKMHQVLYWVSGFKLPDGSVGGMVGSIVDITAQREAQQALSVAIDQQKALFDSAPLGIIELKNRRVVQCNRKFETMLGYQSGELLGHSTREWFSNDEDFAAVGKGYEVLRRGETYTGEHQFTRKDGSKFWCRIFGHAVDIDDPEHHSVWQFEDVTEKRAAEEQLHLARDMAEEATLAKSMFLANMSHEIRTPMNAVIGLAHLALKTELDAKQRDYVTKIHSAGISLLSVINDILDFSKIESGRMDLEQVEFSLDQVLSSVTNTLAYTATEAGLELLFDVADDVPSNLVGDPLRLGQILLNLVSNAIKFTHEGEVIIRCQLLDSNDQQIKLQFLVIDSGIGMDDETCSRLFQPFVQADGSTTRKYGGTGLGLTICKRLVGMMQGDIWVTSVPGQGSTFTFTAWFGNGHPARPYTLTNELNDLHVLVVDDNLTARSILASQLGFLPCKISHANSGMEAVATVRDMQHVLPVDLVLMDWKMPGLSGLEAARLIKHDASLDKIPAIIMVTAYGREEIRKECDDLKLEGFLVKPVSQSTLIDTLVGIYSASVENWLYVSQSPNYDLSGMRLLVVEDNEINQQIASELLQAVGAIVQIAEHGQEALDKLNEQGAHYDAVLMDLQMPVMDGYEATRRIRANSAFDHLPVLAMTAHATVEERQRCIELGMAAHITKPINPDMLYQALACIHVGHEATPGDAAQAIGGYAELEIEGFNVPEALRRVAGNQELYRRLLRQFIQSQQGVPDQIRNALQEERRPDAVRLAHTLKGVAANLGAQALSDAAAGLEQALVENADTGPALARLESDLASAVAAVARVLGQQAAGAGSSSVHVTQQEGQVLLLRLTQYLEARDASVQDFLADQAQALRAMLTAQQYDKLVELVGFYQFDAALLVVKPLLATASHENLS